jgi:single-stranded-DNA-specific exonuclease
MYTINARTQFIETQVAGVTFENRQAIAALLTKGEKVYLIREPDNSFDPNAIKVVRWDHQHFGYLNRELAKILAPRMDCYGRPVPAFVTAITGGLYPGSSLGVWIKFYLPG